MIKIIDKISQSNPPAITFKLNCYYKNRAPSDVGVSHYTCTFFEGKYILQNLSNPTSYWTMTNTLEELNARAGNQFIEIFPTVMELR